MEMIILLNEENDGATLAVLSVKIGMRDLIT